MAGLPPLEQAQELIKNHANILVVIGNTTSVDSVASGLALAEIMKKLDKQVSIVARGPIPDETRFLEGADAIRGTLEQTREYICTIKTEGNPITQLRYDKQENALRLYLTPKQREIQQSDIEITPGKFLFDLIIVCNACDLEQLGDLYEQHAELFYELPILNIDHHASNEYFGTVNLVDVKASSTTELIASLFLEHDDRFITERIATALLAGIIADTESFQAPQTTPRALITAATLIEHGANQQSIMKRLYKTNELSMLKLWGRTMARLEMDEKTTLAWSMLTQNDFAKTGTTPKHLAGVLLEIKKQFPSIGLLLLLFEEENGSIHGRILKAKHADEESIIKAIHGIKGPRDIIQFSTSTTSITDAERTITKQLNDILLPHGQPPQNNAS